MKVKWTEKEPPIQQDCDPRFNIDNLVITVKKIDGPILEVCQTSATCHPNGDSNLVIEVR